MFSIFAFKILNNEKLGNARADGKINKRIKVMLKKTGLFRSFARGAHRKSADLIELRG